MLHAALPPFLSSAHVLARHLSWAVPPPQLWAAVLAAILIQVGLPAHLTQPIPDLLLPLPQLRGIEESEDAIYDAAATLLVVRQAAWQGAGRVAVRARAVLCPALPCHAKLWLAACSPWHSRQGCREL